MKKSNSHIRLTWNIGFTLDVPTSKKRIPLMASRILSGACLLSVALGFEPFLALLLAG